MNYNKYIQEYLDIIDNDIIPVCKEQKLLSKFVKKIFETENLIIDDEQVEKYFSYQKYFPFDLFPWEKFCFVLHNCVFREDGLPRFSDLFILVGRGSGKNAYLAFEDFCLVTPTNGIKNYDIDISANSEDQAKTTFMDIYNILEDPKLKKKMKKNFYWNKEEIINIKTKSKIKFRTNNPKGKDGLRSGKVDFDEIHAYQNWENINVFTTGLGKKEHPRRTYITTNGDVRDGPLDNLLEKAISILKGKIEDNGFLPFICRLDKEDEVEDSNNWSKANPSLPYRPSLMEEMKKEYADYKINPYVNCAFMTKRMNIHKGAKDSEVTSWENILATKKQVPDLAGASCCIGIDYTKVNDFLSVCLLFRKSGMYYVKTHSWFCSNSRDKDRIKAPIMDWANMGLLTIVDDIEINPKEVTEWIEKELYKYDFVRLGVDNFRYALISSALKEIGIDAKDKDKVKMVRPSDIMKIVPVIDSMFNKQQIAWGDNPLMRWFTNNTKLVSKTLGNFVYDKIEPKSRKTDGFMAFVHAVIASIDVLEEEPDVNSFFGNALTF